MGTCTVLGTDSHDKELRPLQRTGRKLLACEGAIVEMDLLALVRQVSYLQFPET